MTNEALINKIKSWLEDEEVAELEMYTKKSIRDQPDPDYYIEFKFKRVKISLIFPYNKDDNFNVVTRNHLSKDLLRVQRDRYDTDLLKKLNWIILLNS